MTYYKNLSAMEIARQAARAYVAGDAGEYTRMSSWCKRSGFSALEEVLNNESTVFHVGAMVLDAAQTTAVAVADFELSQFPALTHPLHTLLVKLGDYCEISYASILNASAWPIDVDIKGDSAEQNARAHMHIIYPICLSTERIRELVKHKVSQINSFYLDATTFSERDQRIVSRLRAGNTWRIESNNSQQHLRRAASA